MQNVSELGRLLQSVGEAGPEELFVISDALEEAGDPLAAGLRVVAREGYRPWRNLAVNKRWWWWWMGGCPDKARGEVPQKVFLLLKGKPHTAVGVNYDSASEALLDLARVIIELGESR